jgi:hypothetical protein
VISGVIDRDGRDRDRDRQQVIRATLIFGIAPARQVFELGEDPDDVHAEEMVTAGARYCADDAGWALPSGACEDITQSETADAADPSQAATVEGDRHRE